MDNCREYKKDLFFIIVIIINELKDTSLNPIL